MTICLAIGVFDGLVLATDTAVTVTNPTKPSEITHVFRHGSKVFSLHSKLPIAAMSAGTASIDGVPVKALAREFRKQLEDSIDQSNYSISDVVERAKKYFFEDCCQKRAKDAGHILSFWIGGYSSSAEAHELWQFMINGQDCVGPIQLLTNDHGMGITWGGAGEDVLDPIHRLLKGYSSNIKVRLEGHGVVSAKVFQILDPAEVALWHSSMPIQEAIDLAEFLVDMTKRYIHYMPGPELIGGDTEIATMTRHDGFRWIRRSHYYPAHLNMSSNDGRAR